MRIALEAALFVLITTFAACTRNPGATVSPAVPDHPAAAVSTPAQPALAAVPTEKLGTVDRDLTYCTVEGDALEMDVYYPKTATGPVPMVMYVHGGGWSSGDKTDGIGARFIKPLVESGFVVTAVNYRLAPQFQFPAQLEDIQCAIRYLRANAAMYGIDPARFGVMGGSAGGHLVAMMGVTDATSGFAPKGGYTDQSSRVQAVVDMFGPTDFSIDFSGGNARTLSTVFGASSHSDPKAIAASPVAHVTSDDPPFLLLHGENDSLVPIDQSQRLLARLQAAGVSATLVTVKNAGHSFAPSGGTPSPNQNELAKLVKEFFTREL